MRSLATASEIKDIKPMQITLYTDGCPKCKVLKQKLDMGGIHYRTVSGAETMLGLGYSQAPMLDVGGRALTFSEAIKWLRKGAVPDIHTGQSEQRL